jgi:3-oxoadipate enol-lactonase
MPYADLEHARLHYEIDGPGDRPVLAFSHSIGASLRMWDGVLPAFDGRFRILRYDTRGHGSSGVPHGPYTIAQLGQDVLQLLDALKIERLNFCGLSLGGMIGMWLGAHAPQRVEKLVLANTAARIGTRETWNARIAAVQQGGMEQIADAVMERWFTARFRQELPGTVASARNVFEATSVEGYTGCAAAIRDADLEPRLRIIEAPTLILTGAVDPATTAAEGRALARQIRNSSFVELETAHLSAIEDPRGFSAAVLGFLCGPEA